MTTQLRDYRVRRGAWEPFLEAWRRQVPLLRGAHGFEIEAWALRDDHRLVWFLSHSGSVDEFEAADRAYYDSEERRAFDPDPREFLERADHFFVERISLPR
ncbi:MAG: NIPSNAP family containing protein [Chloroflexota bacterium]